MKKLSLLSITALSLFALAACSTDKKTETKPVEKVEQKAEMKEETTQIEQDNSKYDAVIEELKTALDSENTGLLEIKVENEVISSDVEGPHDNIQVFAIGKAKEGLKELINARDTNTLTPEQDTALMMFRALISEIAKKLPEENTTISFGYEIGYNESQLIALSTKNKDLIPVDSE